MNKFYESNKTWNILNRFERYRVLVLYAFGLGIGFSGVALECDDYIDAKALQMLLLNTQTGTHLK